MNTKEYLSQAFWLDRRINSKLEQVSALKELAGKITYNYQTDFVVGSKPRCKWENAIVKIIDLENQIDDDIDKLVDLKQKLLDCIAAVKSNERRLLLELRYLNYMQWEHIAVTMNYSYRQIHRIHGSALEEINNILSKN